MMRPCRIPAYIRTLAFLAALTPATVLANIISMDGMFSANARSIWTGQPGVSIDRSGFLGPNAWNIGDSAGKIVEECIAFVCGKVGAEIGARTSGRAGIDYGLKLDSGTFDVHFPARLQLTIPDAVSWPGFGAPIVDIGTQLFSLQGGLALPSGPGQPVVIRNGVLQVRGPDLQAHLTMVAELQAFAGAQICVLVTCYGPGIGPLGVNKTKEVLSINNNGDGQLRLLGEKIVEANKTFSELNGHITGSVNLPKLDGSGGFVNSEALAAAPRDRVAVLNVNLAQFAADLLAIPLSGKLGPIGYNLLQANAGAFLDVQETVTFTRSAKGQLAFTSNVIPIVNNVEQPATQLIRFNPGETVLFRPETALDTIGVQARLIVGGHVDTSLDLVIGGNVDVKALGLDVAGVKLGPLINERFGSDNLGSINVHLFDSNFDLDLGSIGGRPFNLAFSNCKITSGENSVGFCGASGFGPGDTDFLDDGFRQDEFSFFSCASYFSGPQPCFFSPVGGITSPYYASGFGDAFISGDDARTFNGVVSKESTTDAGGWAALQALGPGPGAFIIPQGDPFEAFLVSEPATLALLGLALAGFAGGRGARRGRASARSAGYWPLSRSARSARTAS
jgi:hypothetical protein